MNGQDPDIEAEITFLKSEDGGREGYVVSDVIRASTQSFNLSWDYLN